MYVWFFLYVISFWIFAGVFILIRTLEEGSPQKRKSRWGIISHIIKPIPAGLAALNLFLLRPSSSIFYLIMTVGLILCLLGDIGMEIGLIPGIGLFMFAQITFTTAFLSQSLLLGISSMNLILTAFVLVIAVFYLVSLMRYLLPGLGKFKIPVLIYAIVISSMMVSSYLLLVTSGIIYGGVVFAGAVIFVISDSLIGVREFHHKFSQSTIKIMGTYFLAVFLLSLTVLVYIF